MKKLIYCLLLCFSSTSIFGATKTQVLRIFAQKYPYYYHPRFKSKYWNEKNKTFKELIDEAFENKNNLSEEELKIELPKVLQNVVVTDDFFEKSKKGECPICCEQRIKVTLPCGHVLCKPCLMAQYCAQGKNKSKCAYCNKGWGDECVEWIKRSRGFRKKEREGIEQNRADQRRQARDERADLIQQNLINEGFINQVNQTAMTEYHKLLLLSLAYSDDEGSEDGRGGGDGNSADGNGGGLLNQ